MPDIIITPSSGKLEFVDTSAQSTRRHSFTMDANDGLNLDAHLSAAAISAPLNVINVTVNNSNANYPFVLAQSGETGAKNLLMDGAGGTYNPFTNTATIDISGNSATTTLASNSTNLGGVAAASYVTLTGTQTLTNKTITGTFTGNLTGTGSWATNAVNANTATNSTQLNGQSDSYYTNIPARLGYTPVNKAGDTISGNLTVNGNFAVNGSVTAFSASNIYITSSTLTVTDNILLMNALSPYQRYAGIQMYDSGSGTLSQFLWDGEGDYFFLTGSSVNGKIITGPDGQNNLTANYIPKATAGYKLGNSLIYDDGTNVAIGTTSPAQKLDVVGNIRCVPASSAWAEGLSFSMPTTSSWGGLRWRRERANADGNHYIGYIGTDTTDDLVFGSNNAGTQIDNNIRITKAGLVGVGTSSPVTKFHVVGVISGSSFSGAGTGLTGTAASLTAGTANSVAWTNVSSRPTAVSSFTNDSLYQYHRGDITSLSSSATNVVQPLGTFDGSNITNAPTSGWYNYLSSTHGSYLTSLIANLHRTADWYVGYKEGPGGTPTNPSWYKLLHSGNYTDYTVTKTGTGASGTWAITSSWATNAVTALNVGNGTITIAAGTGVGVGTTNTFTTNQSGATTVTITNTGVTSLTTNTGLSSNVSATGAVTVTNTGVTSNVAGTGISVSGATGAVTITNSGVTSAVAGTGVSVSGATGAVTFSIGQAVGTGNSPTFAGLVSTGNVGIGTTSATARLHVSGSTGGVFEVDTAGNTTSLYVSASGNIGVNTTDFSYTTSDNSRLVGSNTNNKLFVNGSIQLLGNNDAIVFGRGTATFLTDEELGFGWGGGWYMVDDTWVRVRNNKYIYGGSGVIRSDGEFQVGGSGTYFLANSTETRISSAVLRVVTDSITAANAGTRGFILDGNYTNGQYRHRWRKYDDGNGLPLYIDYAHATANSYTTLARFGGGGSYNSFTVYGTQDITGNLGIGTTNPISRLQVGNLTSTSTATPETISLGGTFSNSAGSNIKLKVYEDVSSIGGMSVSSGQMEVNTWSNGKIAFYRGTTQTAIIDNVGNVGIGTSNPSWLLTVYAASAPQFALSNGTRSFILTNNSADNLLSFYYNSSNRLQFDLTNQWFNTGNLGIGTTNPAALLNIRASAPSGATTAIAGTNLQIDSNSSNYISFINTADNGTYAGLVFTDNNNGAYIVFRNYTGDITTGSDSLIYGTFQDHIFQTGFTAGVNSRTEVMRIKNSGYVGINTNNPTARLQVVQGNSGGVAAILLSTDESTIQGPSANTQIRMGSNLVLNASSIIPIGTNGSERVRIQSDGNVGIGTTSAGRKLDVEGIVRTRGASGTGGFEISAASSGTAKWRIEWDSASDSLDFNWVG